jgi:hypothetical protein
VIEAARPIAAPVIAPAVPAIAPPPPPPPVPEPARELRAQVSVDASGSLPHADVERAVLRQKAAIARCVPAAPETVVAQFTIGEAKRAHAMRVSGPTPQTSACVSAALSEVRTEAAPDVGDDVEVTVRVQFVVKT